MVAFTNQQLLQVYDQHVANLNDPDETGLDEELVLTTREVVAKRADWDSTELAEIDRIDDLLVKHWEQFQDALPNSNYTDRSHWWWFLNEGPQVREQAKQLDTEATQA